MFCGDQGVELVAGDEPLLLEAIKSVLVDVLLGAEHAIENPLGNRQLTGGLAVERERG